MLVQSSTHNLGLFNTLVMDKVCNTTNIFDTHCRVMWRTQCAENDQKIIPRIGNFNLYFWIVLCYLLLKRFKSILIIIIGIKKNLIGSLLLFFWNVTYLIVYHKFNLKNIGKITVIFVLQGQLNNEVNIKNQKHSENDSRNMSGPVDITKKKKVRNFLTALLCYFLKNNLSFFRSRSKSTDQLAKYLQVWPAQTVLLASRFSDQTGLFSNVR